MSFVVQQQDCLWGLHHLVEAATALSGMGDTNSPQNASQGSKRVVSDDEEESNVISSTQSETQQNSQSMSNANGSSCVAHNNKEIFPQRLMHILSQPSISNIITWLPQGRSFVIIDPDVFASKILPQFFAETTSNSSTSNSKSKNKKSTACKYPSFTRKLNRWGFRQISRGPDAGAFHHPLFQRDKPQLCLEMVCQKSRRPSSSKLKGSPELGHSDSSDISKPVCRPLQSVGSLSPLKREISVNTITDMDTVGSSYSLETKALPPKKRKLRHSQIEISSQQNANFITSPESLSHLNKLSITRDQILSTSTSTSQIEGSLLQPKDAIQDNLANREVLKKKSLPSFHKAYLDSGAAQERSKQISEFLKQNLLDLQRMNIPWTPESAPVNRPTVESLLFPRIPSGVNEHINNILCNVQTSQQTPQLSNTLVATNPASKTLNENTRSVPLKNTATKKPNSHITPHMGNMKEAQANLYKAYLQALSS